MGLVPFQWWNNAGLKNEETIKERSKSSAPHHTSVNKWTWNGSQNVVQSWKIYFHPIHFRKWSVSCYLATTKAAMNGFSSVFSLFGCFFENEYVWTRQKMRDYMDVDLWMVGMYGVFVRKFGLQRISGGKMKKKNRKAKVVKSWKATILKLNIHTKFHQRATVMPVVSFNPEANLNELFVGFKTLNFKFSSRKN